MTPKKDPSKPHGLKGRKRPQHVRDAISRAHKGKPKSYTCYLKGRTGALHPSYKDGKGYKRAYDHEKQAAWIQGVKRACDFKCFITGQSHNLECHHLISWSHEPTRYEIGNGVALAKQIHVDFHNKYGRGGTTVEQFEMYCRDNYQITEFPWRHGNHKPSFTILQEGLFIKSLQDQKKELFLKCVEQRGDQIIEGSYQSNSSLFKIRCLTHQEEHTVKAGNYKKARFGLGCCSKAKQSVLTQISNRNRGKSSTST